MVRRKGERWAAPATMTCGGASPTHRWNCAGELLRPRRRDGDEKGVAPKLTVGSGTAAEHGKVIGVEAEQTEAAALAGEGSGVSGA